MKNHHDHCSHDHSHGPSQTHGPSHGHAQGVKALDQKPSRAFQISIVFNLLFVMMEFYYGFVSQSLALVGDALHNLGDVFSLVLSWVGFYLARSRVTERLTFGWKKFSILAAFFNAATLILTSLYIIYQAYERFQNPQPQNSLTMMIVSGIGFFVNLSSGLLFHGGHKHDLNLKSAYLHLLGDAFVSLGVVIAGALIYFYGWQVVDPIVSIIISIIVLFGTWSLFKESIVLMLNGVPQQVSYGTIHTFLKKSKGVQDVLQLRIWAISTSEFAMTAKLRADAKFNLAQVIHQIEHDFNIKDITIQVN